MKIHNTLPIFAISALATTSSAVKGDVSDYSASQCDASDRQTIQVTVTVTVDEAGATLAESYPAWPTGEASVQNSYDGNTFISANTASSYAQGAAASWTVGASSASAPLESGSYDSGSGSMSGSYSSGSASGASSGSDESSGSLSESTSGGKGSTGSGSSTMPSGGAQIGQPFGIPGDRLKPSIIPTATYGPWAIIDGDVHDYSESGSGAYSPQGVYEKPDDDHHGVGHGDGKSSVSTSSAAGKATTASWSDNGGYGSGSYGSGGYGSGYGNSSMSAQSATYVSDAMTSTYAHTVSASSASSSASKASWSSSASASASCTPCAGNTASTRDQWCQYNLQTDYYETVPCTGKTREYTFELSEFTASPDGWPRLVQGINGQVPGPTIEADWGDEVVIHLTNSLPADGHNGTSLHFHGIQQLNTNSADGVNSVTQCPIPPGGTYTYRWRATQYGSSWYHSHFGFQAWNGVFGAIIINGPASANYDEDVGLISMSDWNHWTADMLYPIADSVGVVTNLNGLINGKNKWNTSISSDPTSPGAVQQNTTANGTDLIGEYSEFKFEQGKSYRLRLVNVAIDSGFRFSIDGHTLKVIAADFVPIEPWETDTIFLYMGQRYDVIVQADQTSASEYWMRAIPMTSCSDNSNQLGIKGIVRYSDSSVEPTTTAYTYTDECLDEPLASLVPVLQKDASAPGYQTSETISAAKNDDNMFYWTLNGTSFLVAWDNPMLLNVYNNDTAAIEAKTNEITLPTRGEWFYLLIQEPSFLPVPHPIHLHGHDFYILGSGTTAYTGNETLQTTNPPRRDVATLPPGGWLMLAWQADNPGTWLAHCHIGWHTLEGFALQFLELQDEILQSTGIYDDQLVDTCDAWNTYAAQYAPVQGVDGLVDSGL